MEARPFQDACDADKVQRSCRLFFMLLEDQKLLRGRIDPSDSRDTHKTEGLWKLENQNDQNDFGLGLE